MPGCCCVLIGWEVVIKRVVFSIMQVAFRVDASEQIGTGHFMRCLTLADAFEQLQAKIYFICRHLPEYLREMLKAKGYICLTLEAECTNNKPALDGLYMNWLGVSQEQDAKETKLALSSVANLNWLVVDHYALDVYWERQLKSVASRCLVIDDLANREHDCDILLDQNICKDMDSRYMDLVPDGCKLLLGPSYALLRDEFVKARAMLKTRQGTVKNVLVFFGGMDIRDFTSITLNALLKIGTKGLDVNVIIGERHPNKEKIMALCKKNKIQCHVQTKNMAKLMSSADLAIGAGGTATYERLFLKLPSLLTPVSDNQVEPLEYMEKLGLYELFHNEKQLVDKLRKSLSKEIPAPPDCIRNGKPDVVRLMVKFFCELVSPKPFHVRNTYKWLQDNQLRKDFMLQELPNLNNHFSYWRKLLESNNQNVYSIVYESQHVGNCGLKGIDDEHGTCELWIYIGQPDARGLGIAKTAVLQLLSIAKTELLSSSVFLHVARNNKTAIRLYEKTGFCKVEEKLTYPWRGKEADVLRMECKL